MMTIDVADPWNKLQEPDMITHTIFQVQFDLLSLIDSVRLFYQKINRALRISTFHQFWAYVWWRLPNLTYIFRWLSSMF